MSNNLVRTSYKKEDVVVLLKDLSLEMQEMSTEEREKAIQSGTHYSEMLPEEKAPSKEYEALYNKALQDNKYDIAKGIASVAEIMFNIADRSEHKPPIIVSLARAGIPVGILIKRYIKRKYGVTCPHYAISIIRDKGIDENVMEYIYKEEIEKHGNIVENIFFVDGWTGKGAIKTQLDEAVLNLKELDTKWKDLCDDLYVLAKECAQNIQVNAKRRGIQFVLEGRSSLVKGNRHMLCELIENLCENGIRYNNEGGFVHLTIGEKNGRAILSVEDNGIGIPEKHQARVFERFYRVDKSRSKATGGTGLGLAIVKHIVAIHSAEIELKSEVGKGTAISVKF